MPLQCTWYDDLHLCHPSHSTPRPATTNALWQGSLWDRPSLPSKHIQPLPSCTSPAFWASMVPALSTNWGVRWSHPFHGVNGGGACWVLQGTVCILDTWGLLEKPAIGWLLVLCLLVAGLSLDFKPVCYESSHLSAQGEAAHCKWSTTMRREMQLLQGPPELLPSGSVLPSLPYFSNVLGIQFSLNGCT